jgi:hypothetical protein
VHNGEKVLDSFRAINQLDRDGESDVRVRKSGSADTTRGTESFNSSPDRGADDAALSSLIQQDLVEPSMMLPIIFTEKNHQPGSRFIDWHRAPFRLVFLRPRAFAHLSAHVKGSDAS